MTLTVHQLASLRGIAADPRFPVTPTLRLSLKRNKPIRAVEPPRSPYAGRRRPQVRAHELTEAGRAALASAAATSDAPRP